MIFEPRSLEKHEKIEFLVSLTISFMKILIFFLNSDFLPIQETLRCRRGPGRECNAEYGSAGTAGPRKGYEYHFCD